MNGGVSFAPIYNKKYREKYNIDKNQVGPSYVAGLSVSVGNKNAIELGTAVNYLNFRNTMVHTSYDYLDGHSHVTQYPRKMQILAFSASISLKHKIGNKLILKYGINTMIGAKFEISPASEDYYSSASGEYTYIENNNYYPVITVNPAASVNLAYKLTEKLHINIDLNHGLRKVNWNNNKGYYIYTQQYYYPDTFGYVFQLTTGLNYQFN
jgi:hypothetical protein